VPPPKSIEVADDFSQKTYAAFSFICPSLTTIKTALILFFALLAHKAFSQNWCFIKNGLTYEISGIYSTNLEGSFFNIRISGALTFSVNTKDGIKLTFENDSSLILRQGSSSFGSYGTEVSWLIPEDKLPLVKSSRLKKIKFSIPVIEVLELNIPKSERNCIQSSML